MKFPTSPLIRMRTQEDVVIGTILSLKKGTSTICQLANKDDSKHEKRVKKVAVRKMFRTLRQHKVKVRTKDLMKKIMELLAPRQDPIIGIATCDSKREIIDGKQVNTVMMAIQGNAWVKSV